MIQKTLKSFLEVYKPKSPDEQKFVDKHVVIKHKDRNGNDDDVFKASKIKPVKRKDDGHGYDVGDDEKVYEEVELDEISGSAIKRYIKKSGMNFSDAQAKADADEANKNNPLRKGLFNKNPVKESVELDDLFLEGTVSYKNYTITSHPKMGGMGEAGDIKHVFGQPKKMGKLGIEHDDSNDYATTRRVVVKNNSTGDETHHHVYQSERNNSRGKPTISIRTVGKSRANQDKHTNVIAHYLSGKIKIKESVDQLLGEALDLLMSIDEKTLTPAEMKKREEVVKAIKRENPKMDKSMAYAVATKAAKRVAEEVEELDEMSSYEVTGEHTDGHLKTLSYFAKSPAHAKSQFHAKQNKKDYTVKSVKRLAEEVEELDESAKIAAHLIKRYGDNVRKSHVVSAANDFGVDASKLAKAVRVKLGKNMLDEELDELSKDTMLKYLSANKKSGARGGPDTIKRMRGTDMAVRKYTARDNKYVRVPATEEVESIDEGRMKLDKVNHIYHDDDTETKKFARDYVNGHKGDYSSTGPTEKDDKNSEKFHTDYDRETTRHGFAGSGTHIYTHKPSGKKFEVDKTPNGKTFYGTDHHIMKLHEGVEQVDEISKKLALNYLQKKHERDYDTSADGTYSKSKGSKTFHQMNKDVKSGVRAANILMKKEEANEETEIDEGYRVGDMVNVTNPKATPRYKIVGKTKTHYHVEKPNGDTMHMPKERIARVNKQAWALRKAKKGLTKEDIIDIAISKYVPEEIKFTPEARFLKRLQGLSEVHVSTLLSLFEQLNKDNQQKMIDTVSTEDGINSVLNFVLDSRGE